jgi:hypothetical protein
VRAAASVLAVVHDAPTSNPDSPERRPAAPVDVVGAPRLRNPTKTRRTKKRLWSGDFFRLQSILFAGKARARFDVPSADACRRRTTLRVVLQGAEKKKPELTSAMPRVAFSHPRVL